jgi:pimeloyl-ACP methyl ester carboxylesterase
VLLVHGSNVDCRVWADHGDILSPRYRVIALTQRYCGASAWPDDGRNFSIQRHADDLAAFTAALKLEPVALVGWSYGAAVCLAMATQHARLVERLFLYEPALATFVRDRSAAQAATDDRLKMTDAAKAEAGSGTLERAIELFMDGVNDSEGAFRRLPAAVQTMMRQNARMLPLLFAAPPPSVACEDLGRLRMPVTVALGQDSRAFYQIACTWAARCIPGAQLKTVPDARHLWPIENPPAFSKLVLEFLEKSM